MLNVSWDIGMTISTTETKRKRGRPRLPRDENGNIIREVKAAEQKKFSLYEEQIGREQHSKDHVLSFLKWENLADETKIEYIQQGMKESKYVNFKLYK